MPGLTRLTLRVTAALCVAGTAAAADPCCDPAGPYRAGEAMSDAPATCATLQDWIGRMPPVDGRISMTAKGAITAVDRDAALAYLVLCPADGPQLLCVTYETLGMKPGDEVTVAGGVVPVDDRRVMLDPCLAYAPGS